MTHPNDYYTPFILCIKKQVKKAFLIYESSKQVLALISLSLSPNFLFCNLNLWTSWFKFKVHVEV